MAGRDENFSVFVTKTLNAMGYTWQIVQQRREYINQCEHMGNNGPVSYIDMSLICAGSKREGVIKPLGGDNDNMMVFSEIIATENVLLFDNQINVTVLKIETEEHPPGYAYLRVAKHGGRWCRNLIGNEMSKCLLQILLENSCHSLNSGESYVSSEIFINTMANMARFGIEKCKEQPFLTDAIFPNAHSVMSRAGPSIPSVTDLHYIQGEYDNVYSIKCHCPSLFERFRNRPRKHGWPPEHILQELSLLEAHVVPVGHKKSATPFLEWRICFTKSEIRLIECLTEAQTHVFILLKIFAKDVLKESWDVMTSYVMKNVILWMAELIPAHKFRTDTIVDRFIDCLFFLKLCLKSGNLPNYMIPDRNLLCHSQLTIKRKILLVVLDECLREKGCCLLMSSRLKDAMMKMYTNPESMIKFGMERDKTEKSMMAISLRAGPDFAVTASPQDLQRFVLSGNASDIVNLIVERFSIDELSSDPMGALQRIVGTTLSHLQ